MAVETKCDKVSYTKKGAQTVLNQLRGKKELHRQPERIYQCPECNYWHITSKPKA